VTRDSLLLINVTYLPFPSSSTVDVAVAPQVVSLLQTQQCLLEEIDSVKLTSRWLTFRARLWVSLFSLPLSIDLCWRSLGGISLFDHLAASPLYSLPSLTRYPPLLPRLHSLHLIV
jgi:hypothetical protein